MLILLKEVVALDTTNFVTKFYLFFFLKKNLNSLLIYALRVYVIKTQ